MSGSVPAGFVLMPKRVTPAMAAVMADADWTWAELLAAANAINKEEHAQLLAEPPTLDELQAQLNSALNSLAFYRRRCEALQQWQSKMRDPERTIVCDILANGQTLAPEVAGDRYK